MTDTGTLWDAGPSRGQIPPPACADGADLSVVAKPHDQGFWDRHPDVAAYRVVVPTGPEAGEDLTVLIWLNPQARRDDPATDFTAPPAPPPERPADLTLSVHAAYDLGFFARHPDLAAWKVDLRLSDLAGHGAEHVLNLWLRSQP